MEEDKTRRQLKSIYEESPIGIELYDTHGTLLHANPACLEIFGVSDVAQIKRFNLFEDPNVTDDVKARLRQGETVRYEVAFDFELVKKHRLYETTRSGTMDLSVLVTPPGLAGTGPGGYLVHVQDITERKRAEERVVHVNRVLSAIRNVNQLIVRQKDRDRLLQAACDLLIETRGYHSAWIVLLDKAGGLVMAAEAGLGEAFSPLVRQLERGELTACVRRALAQAEVVVSQDPPSTCADCPLAAGYAGRGAITSRLEHGGKAYGLLSASMPAHLVIDDEEQFLFQETGQDIAFALHNIELEVARNRAEEEIRRHTTRLEVLHQVSLELATERDLGTLLLSIVEQAIALVGGRWGSFELYRLELDALVSTAMTVNGPDLSGTLLQRGEGLAGKVWESDQPLIVDDYQHWQGRAAAYEGQPLRAAVGVPVRWGDEFLGVLNIGAETAGAFAPGDAELLGLFADQAAIAIHNARLFAAERAAREQAEKLLAATQALGASLDLQQVFERILTELQYVVPYDSASIQQLKGNRLEIIGGHGFPNLEELLGKSFDLTARDNPNSNVIRTRVPLILDDAPVDYQAFCCEPHAQLGIRAWLGVPLLFGDRLIGLITLDKQDPGFYTEEHARLALAFAAQAAIAIENARLYQEAVLAAERRAVLHRASQEIIRALHDPEQVYQAIHRAAAALMPTEAFVIVLRDEAGQQNEAVYLVDKGGRWPARRIPADQGLSGQVMAGGQALSIHAFSPDVAPQAVQFGEPEHVRAILAVPLRRGEKVIGMISAQSYQPEVYTAEDQVLLEMLAAHAAAALENTRLYDEAQRRNRELALLNRVIAASAAAQATELVLETVCRELALYFDLPQSAAALFDADKTQAVVVAEYRAEGRPSARGESLPVAGNPSMAHLLAHKTPLVIEDAQTDPRQAPIHDLMRRRGTVSLLLVPLLVEGEVVGSVGVDAVESRRFTAEEVDLAQRVAGQAGGALARARLEERQQRLSTAVEQSPDSVLITDSTGTILYANPAFEHITGYRREEVLGRNPRLLESGQHNDAFYQDLWQTISAGQVWQGRFTNRKKDGSLYIEDAAITPLRNPSGEIPYYVATMRDVTRELQLEEQFRQAQKMEAVGRLAGGIAHDFNNLLTVILLTTRLLERKLRPQDPLWQHVQRIQDTCQRATNLTKQLLAFSRREIVEPRVLSLNQVLGDLHKMLRRLIDEGIDLTMHLADDLWPVKVDPTQVEQVVVNLAVNARDAMPTGGKLTVETANVVLDEAYAARHLEVEPGEYVLLAVSDTGVGMSEEVKAHLFEPFFTTKERGKGTGLGLATIYGIVKQNGGHIWVYSEVGQGTTFKIYLPRVSAGVPVSARPPLQPAAARGSETVLLVEDEAKLRELTRDILLGQGYQVLTAADGLEGLQVAEAHEGPVHLLLTDVILPRLSGKALADHLRSTRPEMRVLYTSGYTDNAIVHHGVLDEGIALLSKPFELEALLCKVRDVLDATERPAAEVEKEDVL